MQKKVDYLIVGQGLVGTLLAYFLLREKQEVFIINADIPGASSMHSSGIINPITGRRFAKSWRIDAFLPFAKKTYKALEQFLQTDLLVDIEICKIINSTKDENDLSVDMGASEYLPYFPIQEKVYLDPTHFETPNGSYIIKEGLRLDTSLLLKSFKKYLQANDNYLEEEFNYAALDIEHSCYKNISFTKIIFCQGYMNMNNPYFKHIPITPNKGEYLIIRTKQAHQLKYTITSNGIISPISDVLCYIGATYEWVGVDLSLTQKATKHLRDVFENVCKIPYEIISQGVGIRPAIQVRKPILGVHPDYPNMAMINGMGTKGTMLAPYFTHQLMQYLVYGFLVEEEVAIKK
ncbi:MAG: FAD-dependent oxidoreductase [Bacteroidota bacterium]